MWKATKEKNIDKIKVELLFLGLTILTSITMIVLTT